jgi:putative ABC transport system permease protein
MSYQGFLDFFVDQKSPDRAAVRINRVFKNAYPIFNYKYSLNDDIADLQSGISTFVNYGDYSPIAMNGGQSGGVSFDGVGASAISGLVPIKISQDILAQLSNVVQGVIILLIVLIVTMTFIIILLTTSLIINDNIRFISTLKVLGYSNRNIANIVLGMYAIVIVIMFAIGYVAGWFIFAAIIKSIAMNTTLVLPIVYPIWLIFAVAAGVLGIYTINFAIGYRSVANANATQVLQNQEI